jgi:hypothetical protein
MRSISVLGVLVTVALAPVALAHPPPPPGDEAIDWRETPARFEWSTWIGVGFGAASSHATVTARTIGPTPAPPDTSTTWAFEAGADVTVPVGRAIRVGPWIGLHGLEPVIGGEVQVTRAPASLDLFFYRGEGVWIVRGGGGPDHATAAIAWGYRCPWRLWGPYSRTTRYEIGARIVLGVQRAYRDPADWSATLGLEVEPAGALRYLLGIRSWY